MDIAEPLMHKLREHCLVMVVEQFFSSCLTKPLLMETISMG